jgi:hypothetical protein
MEDGRHMESSLFRVALARRLRLRLLDRPSWRPFCGEILDEFGDHALTCSCNGDRTVRHNRFRNTFWEDSRMAGMDTEREKANLLPARPSDDGARLKPGRRPADVFWSGGEPVGGALGIRGVAWDFAITSGMRSDRIRNQGENVTAIYDMYEDFKRQHQQTAQQCQEQGIAFEPLVVEAHGGGWSATLRKVVDNIAIRQGTVSADMHEPASLRIAQRLSICLQAENARAVLKRLPGTESEGEERVDEIDWGTMDAPTEWQ